MDSNNSFSNDSPFAEYQSKVMNYLEQIKPPFPGGDKPAAISVKPLAQGEYNINYLLSGPMSKAVFRINIASQINRPDQILYEYNALQLLRHSGVTPQPYHVDDSKELIDKGILIMEYLPGRSLNYTTDIAAAAKVFSTIHQVQVAPENNHLIREKQPLTLIFDECSGLLESYFKAPIADRKIASLLEDILAWAAENKTKETYYLDAPYQCIVNTEVNSGNFIVNPTNDTTYLIDWEMPRWGDPSSDLCHFISPLTTLWKTDYRIDTLSTKLFLNTYTQHIHNQSLKDTLDERMRLKMPYVLLRGISWSAMAWVAYQQDFAGVRNEQTWKTLTRYMDATFIRSLFSPFIRF